MSESPKNRGRDDGDLPELPDTDDPFELLGVDASADERALKRAYVNRIKVYKPEKAPEAFQRLNEAYELALETADGRDSVDDEWDETSSDELASPEGGDDDNAGDADAVTAPAEPKAKRPKPAFNEDTSSWSAEKFIEAMFVGKPVAGPFLDEWGGEDIDNALKRPGLSWRRLSEQPDRDAAMYIFGRRLQAQLLDGDLDEVLEQIEEPELMRDALAEVQLEVIALRALSTVAWSRPDRAYMLYAKIRSDSGDDDVQALYEAYEGALVAAKAWQVFASNHACPGPMERFLRLALSAGPRTLEGLVADLRDGMAKDPEEYLATLDVMRMGYPPVFIYLLVLAERFAYEPEPTLAELTEDKRGKLGDSLQTIDHEVRDNGNSSLPVLLVLAGLTGLVMVNTLGAAGLAIAGGCLGTAAYLWVGRERSSYRELIRPRLARTVASLGTPPGTIVSWLLAHGSHAKRLKSFDVAVEGDVSLDALSRFARMASVYDRGDD